MAKKKTLAKGGQKSIVTQSKIRSFYSRSLRNFYIVSFAGFFIGMKLCDLIFYDYLKNEIIREKMQDEYWAMHGEPKHLKPQIVKSFQDPSKTRKSWIQIIYGKDKYIPKE